jgi:hypothetical protein
MSNTFPLQAVPLAVSGTGTTSATATLTSTAGRVAYCTGLYVTSSGATSPGTPVVTLTNTTGGTLSFDYPQVAVATNNQAPLALQFTPPLVASGLNTNMVATVTTGAGTTATAITLTGFMI